MSVTVLHFTYPLDILFQGNSCSVDSINDHSDFGAVDHALDTLEFETSEQESVWSVVAAILHMGNVKFSADDDGHARIDDDTEIKYASTV